MNRMHALVDDLHATSSSTVFTQRIPETCPACGSDRVVAETAVDEAGMLAGISVVVCDSCGRELGELPPPAIAREAEPDSGLKSLLPGPDEEPRTPRHHAGRVAARHR